MLDDDDEDRDPNDPDAPAVLPRKPKASALKKLATDAPKASASLDDFITKAERADNNRLRAAIAYFIEELPIAEAKKLMNNLLPGWDAFKRRRLPSLPGRKKKEALPPKSES